MQKKQTQSYTARLEGWYYDHEWRVFCGYVYDDIRQRFGDGAYIHTSHCLQDDGKEGDIVQTLNSTYLLGKPLGAKE